MTTPVDYKKRYENLQISVGTGAPVRVGVTKYRATFMGPGAMAVNKAAMDAFEGKFFDLAKKGFGSASLKVDSGSGLSDVTADEAKTLYTPDYRNALRALKGVFQGKGSPELCQIVLQLAAGWSLVGGSDQASVQKYADGALGLDCNGFAGNFIWHIVDGKPWTDHGFDASEGPNSKIHVYQGGNTVVTRWEDVAFGPYLFLRTNEQGAILDGAGDDIGHIAITKPNKIRPKNAAVPRGVYVVESSATMGGLNESWYSLLGMSAKAKDVFRLRREAVPLGQKHDSLYFKIFQLHGKPSK